MKCKYCRDPATFHLCTDCAAKLANSILLADDAYLTARWELQEMLDSISAALFAREQRICLVPEDEAEPEEVMTFVRERCDYEI